uniref:Ubiquitin-like protease family profile domain-containing protein n=1 Tax=Cucumis melo TaxID=3656 RepID=A0A9I9EG46_CUCME
MFPIVQLFGKKHGKEEIMIILMMLLDELVATHKNEDILTNALGSKEHGGNVRGVGGFVSQSQHFNTVKGKENNIGCQLSIGSINNIVAVAVIVEDNIGCPNVKVLVDVNLGCDRNIQLGRKSYTLQIILTCLWDEYDCARNFFVTDQSKISSHIKDRDLRSRNLANQLEAVNLEQKVLIPYNTGFHWMLHVIDLRENCVYVLDSLQSKVNEDIHGVINRVEDMTSETRSTTLSINSKMETCKGNLHLHYPHQLDSVGCGYYVQKYIHEIVHNSSTCITSLFNTKNAYRQEEIDEIRTKWATFVSKF